MTTPINNIPSTPWHDEGAIARCSYCGRYTLDPAALGETHKQPMCECGQRHGWCGSFKKPGPDAQWSGVPAVTIYKPQNMGKSEQAANLMETVPPLDADEAMKRVWSEWHAYCKDRLRPSMADQMAFYEIAQPILRALAAAPAPQPVAGSFTMSAAVQSVFPLAEREDNEAIAAALTAALGSDPYCWLAITGTAGEREGCSKFFFVEMLAKEYVQKHGGYIKPLYAAAPAPQPVAVKPLEWMPHPSDGSTLRVGSTGRQCVSRAMTPFGAYFVETDGEAYYGLRSGEYKYFSIERTEAEVQSVVQLDYEQRIRSALVHDQPAEIDRLKAENERLKDLVEKLDGEVQP